RGYRFVAQVRQWQDESAALIVREHTKARVVIEEEEVEPGWRATEERPRAIIDLPSSSVVKHEIVREVSSIIKHPETKYATSGDVNIAYQVVGDAPLDLVFVMGWVSHLEYFWAEASFARFLTRLASFSRLILFDKRGTGLSDRVPINELPTLEQRMDDV